MTEQPVNTSTEMTPGGDPRALPDYIALRDELAKLAHPARPDVDWPRVERLSLALFRQNGTDLQTVAWYTLARTRLASVSGLNEGLALLDALVTHHWGTAWPQPVHARISILAGFSQRLQSTLRTLTLGYADLPQVYQAAQYLDAILATLQRLELKNASLIEALSQFMHAASARLEKLEEDAGDRGLDVLPIPAAVAIAPPESARVPDLPGRPRRVLRPGEAAGAGIPGADEIAEEPGTIIESVAVPEHTAAAEPEPVVIAESLVVAEPAAVADSAALPAPAAIPEPAAPPRFWRPFIAGACAALALAFAGLLGWQKIDPQETNPLPAAPDTAALTALAQQSPVWLQDYGFALAAKAAPEDAPRLRAQWQQQVSANALAPEALSGWHQGMEGLQEMTRRLNALDERKGKYLTGSELKSMVFEIVQHFSRVVPVEEQLYQLSQYEKGDPLPAAQLAQTDMYLTQLLNRYALIKQQAGRQEAK